MPVTWLRTHACPSIRLRTLTEILPPETVTAEDLASARAEVDRYKGVTQITKKQRNTGVWASNILGMAPSKALGIKDVGTVSQYRRLIELGLDRDQRPIQFTNRIFFRLLSRDEDPKLLFEFRKAAKANPALAPWARSVMLEAAATALAQAGLVEDPRVRGAAQKIVNSLAHFLRSEAVDKLIVSRASRHILNPDATPPTTHAVALIAYMPGLQRERAGLMERLENFLTRPAPKKSYVIQVGKKTFKPTTQLLGDPLHNDSAGRPKDLPFALHWMELLARLNMLESSASAQRAFGRLLKDCDEDGVWNPKHLRGFPKSSSRLADFAFPLEVDGRDPKARKADVTFRLAYVAKLAGLELEYT